WAVCACALLRGMWFDMVGLAILVPRALTAVADLAPEGVGRKEVLLAKDFEVKFTVDLAPDGPDEEPELCPESALMLEELEDRLLKRDSTGFDPRPFALK